MRARLLQRGRKKKSYSLFPAVPDSSSKTEGIRSTAAPVVNNDIGFYDIVSNQNIDDFTKKILLENPWTLPTNYEFPFSLRNYKGKEVKNYVSHKHLQNHQDWLVFSDIKKGLFRKYCPWFTNRLEGGFHRNVRLGVLVSQPLTNLKKLSGKESDLQNHRESQYHKDAVVAGKNFLRNYENPALEIHSRLNEKHRNKVYRKIWKD
jgi:hypothetical protein